ncbi:MAG: tetratricopeptide repeat protein, partial [Anaerolineae bacterium]|nr:tetratricopeptide repeat protein [Anaerolineae bacterium]
FLLSSSVLSRLTPELCSKILNFPNSIDALALTLNRGLFVTQVAGGFVYHRLFRSFLQNHLKRRDPELFVELHGRAGNWYWEEGDFETAFDHYMSAGLIEQALAVVEHAHMAYFSQGKVETLLMWRSKLEDDAAHIPYLLYKCSIIYTERYMYQEAEAELDLARRAFELNRDDIGLADVELQHMMIMGRQGQYRRVIQKVETLLKHDSLPDRIIARAKQHLALAYLELGEIDAAISLFEAIVPIYQANRDLHALSTVLQDMEVAYTKHGDLDNASRCLQQVVSIRRQLRRPDALALALNNLGYHYHQRHNFKEAIRTLKEGLQLVEQTSNRRAESYLLWSLGDVRRDLGDFKVAQQLYNRAYELSSGMEPSLQRAITLSISTLHRWLGEYALAERLAREVAQNTSQPATLDDWIARAKMYIARAYQSDAQQALDDLVCSLENLDHYRATTEYRLCALYCALACALSENVGKADYYLDEALFTGSNTEQYVSPEILAEIAHSPDLSSYVCTNSRYRSIRTSLEKLQRDEEMSGSVSSESVAHSSMAHQTYSIYVHTLGTEAIECDGALVPPSAWRANRAREFFLYLLFEGPQTRENLSLVFWPDSSPKRVRSNFHTTLYRARQALGENVVVFENDRYRTNPHIDIVCDALQMEDYVRQARLLQPIDARAEDLYQRALKLYRGELLASLDASWVDTYRYRLFEIYIEALLGAGQCARARKDYKAALSIYRRGLENDPYREGIHRALFLCYADLGETYQLLTHFHKMKETFKADLGISPSAETLTLVETLI